ncbi:MAG: Permease of the drug/metabolite transporter (DMT) superfamily [uncultured Rubrobacteraceae bacterium]|uniref:Permease of the drug/metabolite transporter (DMT) superfamily n=1 Tax=uncultured Rubrobacteraceae bacterium TaxID=349277 RepID=A0A6J4PSC1_9ACTN|nr:MAG: Permease of the drug/metabolite transporter (DMT) superfamily [uncultured Rubrobacteraceae bacterium]
MRLSWGHVALAGGDSRGAPDHGPHLLWLGLRCVEASVIAGSTVLMEPVFAAAFARVVLSEKSPIWPPPSARLSPSSASCCSAGPPGRSGSVGPAWLGDGITPEAGEDVVFWTL